MGSWTVRIGDVGDVRIWAEDESIDIDDVALDWIKTNMKDVNDRYQLETHLNLYLPQGLEVDHILEDDVDQLPQRMHVYVGRSEGPKPSAEPVPR